MYSVQGWTCSRGDHSAVDAELVRQNRVQLLRMRATINVAAEPLSSALELRELLLQRRRARHLVHTRRIPHVLWFDDCGVSGVDVEVRKRYMQQERRVVCKKRGLKFIR